ncbi:L,D-transpeptidase family protein [Lamprobacter modestohalophilus]|uniref:L,D-transpeptidase family protein n=1 Tax=Lamprobacter modestohalophilus TaxID=1064514 RepID=UPI002ADECF13|nr:L,D-transpeptidase family protein [Lamprobacter modestohalophilus]MEA1048684.1 L,D-transpeptidase family protein [Lamprobacter modestohalophilus]
MIDRWFFLARGVASPDVARGRLRWCSAGGQRQQWLLALMIALVIAGLSAGCASKPAPPTSPYVDRVLVKKSERTMELHKDGAVYRTYRISLGDQPRGHKFQEGDERTPEGNYVLDWRNPNSSFYKSIHVSYPNDLDRTVARSLGVSPGGMIMIHGLPNWLSSPVWPMNIGAATGPTVASR